jgi:hypothetical protein
MISSLAAGFFLVIPLFFEPRVETERYMKYDELNGTRIILVSEFKRAFHRFGQAKFPDDGLVLGSS